MLSYKDDEDDEDNEDNEDNDEESKEVIPPAKVRKAPKKGPQTTKTIN